MRRKRRIEDLEDAARSALALAYEQALMDNGGDVRGARAAMIQSARRLDLRLLNDLIDRHNRYYPIEANLPSDVQTGCLLVGGKPWEPLPSVTWETLLEAGTSGAS